MPGEERSDAGFARRAGAGALCLALAVAAGLAGLGAAAGEEVPPPRISPLRGGAGADGAPEPRDMIGEEGAADRAFVPPEDIPESGDPVFDDASAEGAPLDLTRPEAQPLALVPAPGAAEAAAEPGAAETGTLMLDARLTEAGPTIADGMTWRVFGEEIGPDGKMRLVGEATGGPVTLKLKPGGYFVHAAYGKAGVTRKVTVAAGAEQGTIVLNAGGLRLTALVGADQPLPPADVSFDVYANDEGGSDERFLLVADAPAAAILGLPAGVYHVVSRYGDENAIVRADIRVEAGKLTEATIYQKAARLTLKLVEQTGGEALANTSWSVVTPAGESVMESVGAFPSVVLAAGEYTAIAKHDGNIYERNFTVEAGVNRDVEVLLRR